jgi:nucleotide-binding universal stress UspA family protein
MFKHILVPLDGSPRAEQVLPLAARLARAAGGSLLLLQVVDSLNTAGLHSVGAAAFLHKVLEKERAGAATYLAGIAASSELQHIPTRIAVLSGQPAARILEVAQQQSSDLVVLGSHGYTGLKRWALGSIAQKVARLSPAPVLLVRNQKPELQMARAIHALVALDGSPFAEAVLSPVVQLVVALSAPGEGELRLVQLVEVPTIEEEFGFLLEPKVDFRQTALQTAGNYLQAIRAKLLQDGEVPAAAHITWTVEECEDAADTLTQIAETGSGIGPTQQASDLIALTTHGRGGLQRWIAGSVTERVLHGSTLPVLIVHPRTHADGLADSRT